MPDVDKVTDEMEGVVEEEKEPVPDTPEKIVSGKSVWLQHLYLSAERPYPANLEAPPLYTPCDGHG